MNIIQKIMDKIEVVFWNIMAIVWPFLIYLIFIYVVGSAAGKVFH